jgi:hypothetical protein
MKDHKVSVNKHCPCTQTECPILGNCVLCVQNHLSHKRHLPECVQDVLRPMVRELTQQMELKVSEDRPDHNFWDKFDKTKHLVASLERHNDEK